MMMKILSLTLLLISAASARIATEPEAKQGAGCEIFLDDPAAWPAYPPILTWTATGEIVLPAGTYYDDDRVISLAIDEQMSMSCFDTFFVNAPASEYLTATCVAGDVFDVAGQTFRFIDLGCNDQPEYDARDSKDTTPCGPSNEGQFVEFGFPVETGPSQFYAPGRVCFDAINANTLYAEHILYNENQARDTSNERPSWREDTFYPNVDADDCYSQATQEATIAELVGDAGLAAVYVNETYDIYLSRGHMAPNADFVYWSLQDSTFYFVNVAPQWQCFNGNNWVEVENNGRYYVDDYNVDLHIYTGTQNVLELPDINGTPVEIWLEPHTNPMQLPVPEYYWKILVNEADNSGVAVIGLNNPHIDFADVTPVCATIQHEILDNVQPDDVYQGVTYACTVQDLASAFDNVASLNLDPAMTLLPSA